MRVGRVGRVVRVGRVSFWFVAPSSEEFSVRKEFDQNALL